MRYFGSFINISDLLSEIAEKPPHIGFEVTNICNASCIFCGYQYMKRKKEILPMDLFKKAIDEFDSFGGESVGFNTIVGDPLVDPYIIERIKYARSKKGIRRIGIFTNGILINKIGAKEILSSGLDDITVSIGGFDEETYARIFRVNHWNSVYEGLLNLLEENERDSKVNICLALRSDMPIWKLLKTPAYKELKKYKFNLEFIIGNFDNWSNRIKQEQLSGTMRLKDLPRKAEPCSILYRVPKILSNGNMTLCGCRDLNGDSELVLWNIRDKSILEMWRDPKVERIRKGFYSAGYPNICKECSMYNDLSFFRKKKIRTLFKIVH